jgi:chromosomal replication initiation ATPase DnaA
MELMFHKEHSCAAAMSRCVQSDMQRGSSLPTHTTISRTHRDVRRSLPWRAATEIVASYHGMSWRAVWEARTTRLPEALARQVATYLLVVGLDLRRQSVARLIGRHHSTVGHAVRVVEDRRDDPGFDALMTTLEMQLRLMVPPEYTVT